MGKRKRDGLKGGEYFQRLVKDIETALNNVDGATVASPAYLEDRLTGTTREHDILITYHHPLRTTLTAIECKDWKQKVGLEVVEAFDTKCHSTGIDVRVIASRSGFTKNAITKARALGIRTITALNSVSGRWELEFIGRKVITEVVKKPTVEAKHYVDVPQPHALWQRTQEGNEIDVTESIYELGRFLFRQAEERGALDRCENDYSDEIRHSKLAVGKPFEFFIVGANGERSEVNELAFLFEYRRYAQRLETEDIQYEDIQSGESVRYVRFRIPDDVIPQIAYLERRDGTFEVLETGKEPQRFNLDRNGSLPM